MGDVSLGSGTFGVLDFCAIAVLAVRDDGNVLAWNDRCARQFRISAREAVGRWIWDLGGFAGWRDAFRPRTPARELLLRELTADAPDTGRVRFRVEGAEEYVVATAIDTPSTASAEALVDAIQDYAVYQLDRQGRIVTWNRGATLLTGYAASEVLGRSFEMFFTAEDLQAQRPRRLLDLAAASGRHEEQGFRLRRGGERFWARSTLTPIVDAKGETIGFAKITQDESARRRSEEQQRRLIDRLSNDRRMLEAVLRQLPVGIVVHDAGGELVAFNDAASATFDPTSPSSRVGTAKHADGTLLREDELPEVRALRGETLTHEQMTWVAPSGEERVFDVSAQSVGGESGAIEASVVVYTDVTERARLQSALAKRERLLRTILEVLPAGVWSVGRDGVVDTINPAARRMWGADIEEHLLACGPGFCAATRDDTRKEWPHERALRSGEPVPEELLRLPDERSILHAVVPIHDDAGGVVGAVAVSDDVTALRRAEEEARAALRARREIVQIVSHDLRNPLNVVSLHTSLLLRNPTVMADEKAKVGLETVSRAVRQMQRLVADLLDAGRVETGRLAVCPMPQACSAILADALANARTLHPAHTIRLADGAPLPPTLADRDRILQVLANLIDNAARSTGHGGTVELRARMEHEAIVWSVSDDGAGIPVTQRAHVFEPFWQGKQKGALGLGLSICRAIVEGHGGKIWVDDGHLGGATIAFTTRIAT